MSIPRSIQESASSGLRREPRLLRERDVCVDVPLRDVDRPQRIAPATAGIFRVAFRLPVGGGRRLRGCIEPPPHPPFGGRPPDPVERLGGVLLHLVTETGSL